MSWFRPAGSLATATDPVHLTPAAAGWAYSGLRVVDLGPGEARTVSLHGVEAAVIPLQGGCTVDGDGFEFTLEGRSSVFEAGTDLCYLPAGAAPAAEATISSEGGGRFAVATARTDEVREPHYYPAEGISVEMRGAGQATRQINGLLSADVDGPHRLIVVEVLTPGGNWSSYPPHKHDEWTDTEVPLEEIYFFQVRGEQGFGLHRTYTTGDPSGVDIDETVTVRSDDVFLIPRGYHGPCVAAPGYDLYYLNVMAGPDPERRWLICTDPDHEWLLDGWEAATPDPRLPMYREETS